MKFSKTRAVFFQVADAASKMRWITETAKAHFSKKESLLFFVENDKARDFVDELLWKLPAHSFLPHIASDQPTSERIVITKTRTNVNGAHIAFNLCPTPLLLAEFKLIYDFEDLTASNKKNLSMLRFHAYKEAQMILESR